MNSLVVEVPADSDRVAISAEHCRTKWLSLLSSPIVFIR